jgi:hypothetical protein
MIKDLKLTGIYLGKYSLPKGRFRTIQYIDFSCTAEKTDGAVIMSIIASYCLDDKTTSSTILKVPCSTNIEFIAESDITTEDLTPLWKTSVKNLRDECNKTNQEPLKNIPYPSNEQVKYSIEEFLKVWTREN